jgi:HAD superfamily hydrolase (TIGR01549 family)
MLNIDRIAPGGCRRAAVPGGGKLVSVIRAVVFDIGEVLVDETREYGTWADWLGVPRHTFSAVFGATIAAGRDYREAFSVFRPEFDLNSEREARADAGQAETFGENDLYPDVRRCLAELHTMGLRLGAAGNQTARAEAILSKLSLPLDWIGSSARWKVEKPSAAFFERAAQESGVGTGEVLYVGDRLDNDIRPALDAGLQTVLLKRGPWGLLLSDAQAEERCLAVVHSLFEIPALIARHTRANTSVQAAPR